MPTLHMIESALVIQYAINVWLFENLAKIRTIWVKKICTQIIN
jgi:hypothetical protein